MDIRVKENRNQLFALFLAIITIMAMASCHKNEEDQVFHQTFNVPSEASQQIVSLTSLKSAISSIVQGDNWVGATAMSYTSGCPTIRLDIAENTSIQPRQTNITVTDNSEKTVILTVVQVKPGDIPAPNTGSEEEGTGIEDSHDQPTDQPAYSRQK